MTGRARHADSSQGPGRSARIWRARAMILFLAVVSLSAEPPPDPVPIQRIQLPPERLAAEMEKVRQRVMARLPREEFEALVKEAARAEADAKKTPQLLECRYRAALEGDGLAGAAEWKLRNRSSGAARLSLDAFQLALRDAHWADKAPAIIGKLDDKPGASWELLIPKPGDAILHLNWSARGLSEPGGIRFDLRLQACPITILELEIPADRVVRADRDSVVPSGPLPSGKPNLSLWRLTFPRKPGGASAAQFVIQQSSQAGSLPPVARPLIQTTQRLMPGIVECEYTLDLQVDRGGLANFVLICDPGLRVQELEAPGLEEWDTKPAPGGGTLVLANLRDPIRGGRMTLRAVSPLPPADKIWTSPGVRVAGGIPRGEKMTLLVHPDLQLEDWKPGGFRPAIGPASSEAMQAIFLQRRAIGTNSTARPQARVRLARPAFDLDESLDWTVDPDRMTLTADWRLTARRGAISELSWSIPAGWEVEQVEAIPADPALRWQSRPDGTLTIEPGHPLSDAREFAERHFVTRLRAAGPKLAFSPDGPSATIPWPDLQPRDVRQRNGRLAVHVNASLIAVAPEGSPALRAGSAIPYDGNPRGVLQIRPRRGRLQARIENDIVVREKSIAINYRLELTPGAGNSTEAAIFTSAPISGEWNWKTVDGVGGIRRIEPLPLGPARAPLAALMPGSVWDALGRWWAADRVGGQYWRILFDQPLQKPMTMELTVRIAAGRRNDIPLLTILGADRLDARVDLRMLPGTGWTAESSGLRELPAPAGSSSTDWEPRSFRFGITPASLVLRRRDAALTVAGPRIDRAVVTVSPSLEGRTAFHFRVAVSGWTRRELPVQLPAGADLAAARLDGEAVSISPAPIEGDSASLRLPWNPGPEWRVIEIDYAINGAAWRGVNRIHLAIPKFPFAVNPRPVWRLPSGVVPLTLASWRPGPGAIRGTIWPSLQRPRAAAVEFGKISLDEIAQSSPPRQSESLGQWLERWSFERRDTAGAIVVDLSSLERTGIDPTRPVDSKLAFESIAKRLEIVTTANAALLTTVQRLSEWRGRIPVEIAAAVVTAAEQGFDDSGRFVALSEWSGLTVGLRGWDRQGEGWIEWDPPGDSYAVDPILIESSSVAIAGMALGSLLLILAAAIRGQRRFFLLAWLMIAAAGLIWLPSWLWGLAAWPLAFGVGWTVFAWVRAARTPREPAPSSASSVHKHRPSSLVVPPALILIGMLCAPSSAAGPEPIPVYLIPGSTNNRDSVSVLAPPELLAQLKAIVRRNEPAAPALITRARYEGRIDGSMVHWDAILDLFCIQDAADALSIPLEGGQLRRAQFDGAELLPRSGAVPGRLLFDLHGQGRHLLRLEFDVPVEGQIAREARCIAPDAAMSSISIQVPPDARFPTAPTARGIQRVLETKNGRRLEADLGRGGVLLVRWHAAEAASPRTQVDEVNMWEMSDSGARLRSVFRYRIGAAAVDQLTIGIPAELELTAATARSVDDRAAESLPTVIKDWNQVAPGQVRLGFEPPLAGQVQLNLEFVPRQALDAQPALPVPTAIGDFKRQSYLAVRLQDLQARVVDTAGWEQISAAGFFRDRWQPFRVDAGEQEPDLAYRQRAASPRNLRLSLQLPDTNIEGNERINWRVGPDRGDVRVTATWLEPPTSGPLEWNVPAHVAVTEVRGAGLRSWSRSGNVVQAWLGGGPYGGRVTLTLVGWMDLPSAKPSAESISFELPPISLRGVSKPMAFIQIQPREGWRIFDEKTSGWSPVPSSDLPGASWSAFSESASQAAFSLRPARGQAECSCVTFAEAAGRAVSFAGVVDVRSAVANQTSPIQTIAVEVRRAEADKLQLQLPPGTRLRESRPTATGMTWMVDCQSGRHRILVTGKLSPAQSREFAMPAVRAHGVDSALPPRRWVIAGPGLRPHDWVGLRPELPPADLLDGPSLEKIRRAATGWAVENDNWRMQLEIAQPGLGVAAPAFVSTLAASAAPGDDGYWLMQARAFLFQDAENLWLLQLPEGAELLAFEIDGIEQTPAIQNGGRESSRSLPSGLHSLRLVWRSTTRASDSPPLLLPRLQIAGVSLPWSSVLWTATAAPGFRLVPGSEGMGMAKMALSRAAAWLEFQRQVADRASSGSLLWLQSAALADLRRAEVNLAVADPGSDLAPDGKSLTEWLRQLRESAPAGMVSPLVFEPYSEAFHRGTPVYWHSSGGDTQGVKCEASTPTTTDKWVVSGFLALLLALSAAIMWRLK